MKKKYPKSAFKLYFKLNSFAPVSGLSNEILCTLVAQETAKLSNVIIGGPKKYAAQPNPHHVCSAWVQDLDFVRIFNFDLW